jgi:hypothetical protein
MSQIRVSHSSSIFTIITLHLSEKRWYGFMNWVKFNWISSISYSIGGFSGEPDLSINHLFSGFPSHPTNSFTISNILVFLRSHFNHKWVLSNSINSSRIWFLDVLSSSNLSKDNRHGTEFLLEINLIPVFISWRFTSLNYSSIRKHMSTFFNNHIINDFYFRMILLIA